MAGCQIVFWLYLWRLKFFEDRVAQLVEQRPFKPWVLGSSPSSITLRGIQRQAASLFFFGTTVKDP